MTIRLLAGLCCLVCTGTAVAQNAPKPAPAARKVKPAFLECEWTRLLRGGALFRNVGANVPDLFGLFLRGEDAVAVKRLADAGKAGMLFVRCPAGTANDADFAVYQREPSRWFAAFDRMLAAADAAGIAVVPSLLYDVRLLPRTAQPVSGKPETVRDLFQPGSGSNELALSYVTAMVDRYKNDTRVLMWEIGNEYNAIADAMPAGPTIPVADVPSSDDVRAFLAQIGSRIRAHDKKHLITTGNGNIGAHAWHLRQARLVGQPPPELNDENKDSFAQYVEMMRFLTPPPVDVVSVHLGPTDAETPDWLFVNKTAAATFPWARTASDQVRKPLFVGEVLEKGTPAEGGTEFPWSQDFLNRMPRGVAPIAAIANWGSAAPGADPAAVVSPEATPLLVRAVARANADILTFLASDAIPRRRGTPSAPPANPPAAPANQAAGKAQEEKKPAAK